MQQNAANKFRKQIQSKWKNLKSLYCKEVQLSSRSGASAPTWPFFDLMQNLLYERLRVQVVLICNACWQFFMRSLCVTLLMSISARD